MPGPAGSPGPSGTPSDHALLSETTIPRNLGRIPNDQRKLLERADSWASNLKTSKYGLVNVPVDVLQDLKRFHASHTIPPPGQRSLESSNLEHGNEHGREQGGEHGSEHGSDRGRNSVDGASESSEEVKVPWTPSPERNRISPPRTYQTPQTPTKSPNPDETPGTARFRSQSPVTTVTRKGTLQSGSSPIRSSAALPVTQEQTSIPPQRALKRPFLASMPSSNHDHEEEDLEMDIPGALSRAMPPVNKVAVQPAITSPATQAGMSPPPCGQGSIIPCSYSDSRSPAKPPSPKRRRMRAVLFSCSPEEQAKTNGSLPPALRLPPATQSSAPIESSLSASSNSFISSACQAPIPQPNISEVATPVSVEPTFATQVVGVEEPIRPSTPALSTSASINDHKESTKAGLSDTDARRERVVATLDREWAAENADWLPEALSDGRDEISRDTLELLRRLTFLAVENNTPLSSLWAAPGGCLHRAALEGQKEAFGIDVRTVREAICLFETVSEGSSPSRASVARPTTERHGADLTENFTMASAALRTGDDASVMGEKRSESARAGSVQVQGRKPPKSIIWARPFEGFCSAYPAYTGSLGDFVKACINIKMLHRKRALPKWLYDDFVRVFAEEYIPYIDTLDDEDDSALTAIEWYVENVDEPVFNMGIITPNNYPRVLEAYKKELQATRNSWTHAQSPKVDSSRSTTTEAANQVVDASRQPIAPRREDPAASTSRQPSLSAVADTPPLVPRGSVSNKRWDFSSVNTEGPASHKSLSSAFLRDSLSGTKKPQPPVPSSPSAARGRPTPDSAIFRTFPSTYTPGVSTFSARRTSTLSGGAGLTQSSGVKKAKKAEKSRSERLKEYILKMKAEGRLVAGMPPSSAPQP